MADIREFQILNWTRHIIASRYLNGEVALSVNEILADMSVICIPVIGTVELDKNTHFKDFYKNLVDYCKKTNSLKLLSKEALEKHFLTYYAQMDSEKKSEYIKCVSIVKEEDNGFVSFSVNEKVLNTYATNPRFFLPEMNYGELSEIPHAEECPLSDTRENTPTAPQKQESTDNAPLTNIEENTLQREAKDQLKSIYNSIYKSCNFNECFPYVWKLKISPDQYETLQRCLKIVFAGAERRVKSKLLKTFSKQLIIYVAEWYRREFEGRNDNAWESIGLDNEAEWLWTNDSVLQQDKWSHLICSTEETTTRWQKSLYLLGGLPLKYRSQKLEAIYDGIFEAIENGDAQFYGDHELNSRASRESLNHPNGSLRLFANSILNNEYPFSDEDMETEVVIEFIRRIEEGRQRKMRKKFRLVWIVRENEYSNEMTRTLRLSLKPEYNGQCHKYISTKRLEEWGIANSDEISSFTLRMSFNNSDDRYDIMRYSNRFNGTFSAWTRQQYIDIHNIPAYYIDTIYLYVAYECNNSVVEKKIESLPSTNDTKDYVVLYPTGIYNEWSNERSIGKMCAVVCRDNVQFIEDSTPHNFKYFVGEKSSDSDGRYIFHQFTDVCNLIVDGREIDLRCNTGEKVVIKVSAEKYSNDIAMENGHLVFHEGESSKQIPIVFGERCIKVYSVENNNSQHLLEKSDYELEFKQNSYSFQEWTETEHPNQGMVTLRVKTAEGAVCRLDCYYFHITNYKNAFVKRNVKEHTISFTKELESLVECNIKGITRTVKNNEFCDEKIESNEPKSETISFKVGDDDKFLIIPVYRPYYRRILYQNGEFLSAKYNWVDKFDAQIILKDNLTIKEFSEKGVKKTTPGHLAYLSFTHNDWKNAVTSEKATVDNHSFDGISYMLAKNGERISINPKYKDDYNFYFWDLSLENDPQKLELCYSDNIREGKSPQLFIDFKQEDKERHGIIFQSLKEGNPPRYWAWIENNINKDIDEEKLQIKCFNVAKEHKVYFHMFWPLMELVVDNNKLNRFFFKYAENNKMTDVEYAAFHRMAEEYKFDWNFLCRYSWINRFEDPDIDPERRKKVLLNLFKSNPMIMPKSSNERIAYNHILDVYFDCNIFPKDDREWERRTNNNGTVAGWLPSRNKMKYNFFRCIRRPLRGCKNKFQLTNEKNSENIKELLKYLYANPQAFQEILEVINKRLIIN